MNTLQTAKDPLEKVWRATVELRWAYEMHSPNPPMLQQMYICDETGETVWLGLPVASVEKFDNALQGAAPRGAPAPPADFICGDLTLRINNPRPLWKGVEVCLTASSGKLVGLLASDTKRFFTFREMYDVFRTPGFQAGDGPNGFRSNVRTAIKRIRADFRRVDPAFDQIASLPSFGYQWKK